MILHPHLKFNTHKAKNDTEAENCFKRLYNQILDNINYDEVICECKHHEWSVKGYYKRYFDFMGRRIRVLIKRLLCEHCGRSHALLIDNMIPFSTLTYNEIISGVSDSYTIDSSHHKFLLSKYSPIPNYAQMCLQNIRKCYFNFVSP